MMEPLDDWFADRGWQPFEFQREAWAAYLDGKSGVVHAPTGIGKTLSAEEVSTEKFGDRLRRMLRELEAAARRKEDPANRPERVG